jgi:hypothetical protein
MRELLVQIGDPAALNAVLGAFGGIVCQAADGTYIRVAPQTYVVRAVGVPLDLVRFVIVHQGYGVLVGERDIPVVQIGGEGE